MAGLKMRGWAGLAEMFGRGAHVLVRGGVAYALERWSGCTTCSVNLTMSEDWSAAKWWIRVDQPQPDVVRMDILHGDYYLRALWPIPGPDGAGEPVGRRVGAAAGRGGA